MHVCCVRSEEGIVSVSVLLEFVHDINICFFVDSVVCLSFLNGWVFVHDMCVDDHVQIHAHTFVF